MSQFHKYTSTSTVENYRKFLGESKQGFFVSHGFVRAAAIKRKGRLVKFDAEAIEALAMLVNKKAATADAPDTDLGERICLARDYKYLTDADLARQLGVSRELVRRWGENLNKPTDLSKVAETLGVPLMWLEAGGEAGLPANSCLGVRVGKASFALREQLYSMTLKHLAEIPETADLTYIQACLEWVVFNHPDMAKVARQAGGRWQVQGQTLVFAPWQPIDDHGLARRFWTDEVEEIIQEELARQHSTYAAWSALKARCAALGMSEGSYPRKISLYKRIGQEKSRRETFGVNMNDVVKSSVNKYQLKTAEHRN